MSNESQRTWRGKHPNYEKGRKAYKKEWYRKNKKRIRKQQKEYHKENAVKVAARQRRYYEKHKKEINLYNKRYAAGERGMKIIDKGG